MPDDRERRTRWRLSAGVRTSPGKDALRALELRLEPDFRRAVASGVVALMCLVVGSNLGGVWRADRLRFVAIALTVGFVVFSLVAIRATGREIARLTVPRGGQAAAATLRLLTSLIGSVFLLLGLLAMTNVDLRGLLVGGVVTGVVVGVAAQQVLGNFFAGLVLLFARPYAPGEYIVVHSGALGGPFEGTIVEAGLIFTTLLTAEGPLRLPNAGLLGAATGPASRQVPEPSTGADPGTPT